MSSRKTTVGTVFGAVWTFFRGLLGWLSDIQVVHDVFSARGHLMDVLGRLMLAWWFGPAIVVVSLLIAYVNNRRLHATAESDSTLSTGVLNPSTGILMTGRKSEASKNRVSGHHIGIKMTGDESKAKKNQVTTTPEPSTTPSNEPPVLKFTGDHILVSNLRIMHDSPHGVETTGEHARLVKMDVERANARTTESVDMRDTERPVLKAAVKGQPIRFALDNVHMRNIDIDGKFESTGKNTSFSHMNVRSGQASEKTRKERNRLKRLRKKQ
jgi:hypothetical protein